MIHTNSDQRFIPSEVNRSMHRWAWQSAFLQCLYVALAVIAILAPLAVSSFTTLLGEFWTRVFSFAAAAAATCIAGFRLSNKGNEMRRSYVELKGLVLRYQASPAMTEEQLIIEYTKLANGVVSISGPNSPDSHPAKGL